MPNPTHAALSITIELDRRINFALPQNNSPGIKSLQMVNDGDVPLRDLEIVIDAEPYFLVSWEARIL